MENQESPGERYEFRVKSHLETGWFRMFPGLSIKNIENGEALITGRLATQAAVYEILERIQALNLILITVTRIDPPAGEDPNGSLTTG